MTFVGSDHAMARPPRPAHDGAIDWSLELGALFQTNGALNAWDDETTMAVTTWYVHHDRRPICNRPRHLQLLGNPITWIYDLRRAWEDVLDRRLPFATHTVKPRPPQFQERSACHIILEQAQKPDPSLQP